MTQDRDAASRGFKGGFRQSMSWLHTWAGLVLSVLLYFMFITGSVGYFNSEVTRWMQPELKLSGAPLPAAQMVERGMARAAELMPEAKEWHVGLPQGRRNRVVDVWAEPRPSEPVADIEYKEAKLDPATGQALPETRATGGGDALYAMHFALRYMPEAVAMYLVGVATMFMLVAIVSGIVVHKKIFKDFFTFRPAKGQRSWLDAHNVSSVMALPFFLMITYSGLLFYTYDYMPSVKLALYGSGEAASERFYGDMEGERYATPELAGVAAPLVPLAPLVAQAEARWGAGSVAAVSVMWPGDANAKVRIDRVNAHQSISREGESLVFQGATGQAVPLREESKSAAATFSSVMLALHEGHFASPLLRWLYFATGLLGAAMIATGMVLWTTKRRQQLGRQGVPDVGLRFVERLNVGTIVGLPVGVAVCFWANRLIPVGLDGRDEWEMHSLFIVWAACLLHASFRPVQRAWVEQLALAVALYALLPLLNALTTDIHLGRTLPLYGHPADWVLAGFDLTMLALALCFAWALRKAIAKQRLATQKQVAPAPMAAAGGEHLA